MAEYVVEPFNRVMAVDFVRQEVMDWELRLFDVRDCFMDEGDQVWRVFHDATMRAIQFWMAIDDIHSDLIDDWREAWDEYNEQRAS